MLSAIKAALLSDEERPIRIVTGPQRGVVFIGSPRQAQQVRFGLAERETFPVLRRAMRECSWFVDIGAAAGEMAVAFALKTHCDPILAIEPSSRSIERLTDAVARNGVADRVTICPFGIGPESGRKKLDDLPLPRDRRGFVKIDVDTWEMHVLETGRRLIQEARPMFLVETHSADLERRCITFLETFGYRTAIIRNAWWRRLIPDYRIGHNRWLLATD